jgi:16S rRNA G1207 methylase RsmC
MQRAYRIKKPHISNGEQEKRRDASIAAPEIKPEKHNNTVEKEVAQADAQVNTAGSMIIVGMRRKGRTDISSQQRTTILNAEASESLISVIAPLRDPKEKSAAQKSRRLCALLCPI